MLHRPSFIPTLDISNGQAVLVRHGQVYQILGDPMEKAKFISIGTHFQIVDIDAAMGTGSNKELIKKIVQQYPCYVGGGIRTYQDAIDFLNSSARRVIISTAIDTLITQIPKERLIVAFDVDKDNNVFSKGRTDKMSENLFQLIDKYGNSIDMMTITFHHAEGTCQGIPYDQVKEIKNYITQKNFNIKLVCAGGIATIIQIDKLIRLDVIPQFGSGFWNGMFTLGDIFQCISTYCLEKKWVSFNSVKLIPTIVQSIDGQVLGLVFSTPETLKLSLDSRVATFYSRDQNQIWIKGATSGNYHRVYAVHYCCDGTSIRFVVDGNMFCHLGTKSCFGHTDPSRASLKSIQSNVQEKLKNANLNSYTQKLLNEPFKINSKILEESQELVCATKQDDVVYETADLLYFTLMNLEKHGINIQSVENELIKRSYIVLKDPYDVQIPLQDKLKIGIILNNMPNQFVFEYLEEMFNMTIIKPVGSSRCLKYDCSNPNIKIIVTKPKDIATLINNKFLDAVVSYEDIIMNYSANVEKIPIVKKKTKQVSIVIACKEGLSLDQFIEINKQRKLTIIAEYVKLTNDWVTHKNLRAKIIPVSGSSESYLVNDLCDMCSVVCDSGTTLRENKLKVLDTLVTTDINLFVHPSKKDLMSRLIV